jgi:hypothetical protein
MPAKRPKTSPLPAPTPPAAAGRPSQTPEETPAEPRRFSIAQYAIMNAVFAAFLLIQLVLVQVFVRETRGLYFFFGLLMAGFVLVSVFDYLYDRYLAPSDQG